MLCARSSISVSFFHSFFFYFVFQKKKSRRNKYPMITLFIWTYLFIHIDKIETNKHHFEMLFAAIDSVRLLLFAFIAATCVHWICWLCTSRSRSLSTSTHRFSSRFHRKYSHLNACNYRCVRARALRPYRLHIFCVISNSIGKNRCCTRNGNCLHKFFIQSLSSASVYVCCCCSSVLLSSSVIIVGCVVCWSNVGNDFAYSRSITIFLSLSLPLRIFVWAWFVHAIYVMCSPHW